MKIDFNLKFLRDFMTLLRMLLRAPYQALNRHVKWHNRPKTGPNPSRSELSGWHCHIVSDL
jgi:hypothetical protein